MLTNSFRAVEAYARSLEPYLALIDQHSTPDVERFRVRPDGGIPRVDEYRRAVLRLRAQVNAVRARGSAYVGHPKGFGIREIQLWGMECSCPHRSRSSLSLGQEARSPGVGRLLCRQHGAPRCGHPALPDSHPRQARGPHSPRPGPSFAPPSSPTALPPSWRKGGARIPHLLSHIAHTAS